MCRFVVYQGDAIPMAKILLGTENSLVKQSKHAKKRRKPGNGDGFGIGWYPFPPDSEPGVFVGLEPAWASRNLLHLTRTVQASHFFAHVRDATPGMPIGQSNCHPFYQGRLLWMHNGKINGFAQIKRALIGKLSDSAFNSLLGNTDSEWLFALFQTVLAGFPDQSLPSLVIALEKTIDLLLEMLVGINEPSYLNIALSNGDGFITTRYTTDKEIQPASLFYATGQMLNGEEDDFRLRATKEALSSVVVASEPLTRFKQDWIKVERNQMLVVDHDNTITHRAIK